MPKETPFRFLDLPKELRLMVYECLTLQLHRHTITDTHDPALRYDRGDCKWHSTYIPSPHPSSLTLITNSISGFPLARTCRLIHDESMSILRPVLDTLREEPIRAIADSFAIKRYNLRSLIDAITKDDRSEATTSKDDKVAYFLNQAHSHMSYCSPGVHKASLLTGASAPKLEIAFLKHPEHDEGQIYMAYTDACVAFCNLLRKNGKAVIDISIRMVEGEEGAQLEGSNFRQGYDMFDSQKVWNRSVRGNVSRFKIGRGENIQWEEWVEKWGGEKKG